LPFLPLHGCALKQTNIAVPVAKSQATAKQDLKSESAEGGQVFFMASAKKVEAMNLYHYACMQYTAYKHSWLEIFCNVFLFVGSFYCGRFGCCGGFYN